MSSNPNVGEVFNLTGSNGGSGSLKLESLSITTPPTKTTYKSGETFDPTGMVVTALYAYGITSDVTGYTVSPTTLLDGTTFVTITYTEGRVTKTVTTPVTVKKVLSYLVITTPPTKTEYHYLETFDPAGMGVSAVFSDGSTVPISDYTASSDPFTTIGVQSVAIGYTYEGDTKTVGQNVTVTAIELPLPVQKDIPSYDGTSKTPSWDNYDANKMTMSGDLVGINAKDDYAVTFTLSYGYLFPGSGLSATVNWAIDRAVIAALPAQVDIPAYDGSVKSPSWDSYDPVKMTISGDQYGTAADEYTATFTPTANYKWWDGTTTGKNATWQIVAVLVTIPTQTNIPTYDGTAKTPEWDNYDTEHSTVSVTPATNAGTDHEATFSLLAGTWSDGTTAPKTILWTIERATLDEVPAQSGTLTYDGNPKTPSWNDKYDVDKMTLTVTAATLAGNAYTASFTPTANYKWWDGSTAAKTATWAIGKAAGSASSDPATLTLNASNPTGSITITRLGNGVISASSSDTDIVTVGTINQTTGEIQLASVDETTGTATITVNVAEGDNYLAPMAIQVTVNAQFVTIWGVEWDWTSSGPTNGVRTDAAAGFSDPVPYVSGMTADQCSSPFDELMPWAGMTKETRTGGVMVKQPKYWFKWTKTGKKLKLQVANEPVTGFYVDPVNKDRGDGLGELDFSYIARYHCGTSDWKSTTGVAQKVSITRSAARNGIHNLGTNIWQIDFHQMWYIGMLYLVEFADWNGQAKIGYGCSASNSKGNNGKTDAMPYHTGTTAASRTTYGYTQYRNIEGWWDNVYDWMDGCYYTSSGLNVIDNPANFSDSANGTLVGLPTRGYPSDLSIPTVEGFEWAVYPSTSSGSDSTYVPDYWDFNGSYPCLSHGGDYGRGQRCGPFCVNYSGTSYSGADAGCRLQERPPKAA